MSRKTNTAVQVTTIFTLMSVLLGMNSGGNKDIALFESPFSANLEQRAVGVLAAHPSDPVLAAAVLHFIVRLAEPDGKADTPACKRLVATHAPGYIMQTMRAHQADALVLELGWRALFDLLMAQAVTPQVLYGFGAQQLAAATLQAHMKSDRTVVFCCNVLNVIMTTRDYFTVDLGVDGVMDAVTRGLCAVGTRSAPDVLWSLLGTAVLLVSSAPNSNIPCFAKAGGVGAVVAVVTRLSPRCSAYVTGRAATLIGYWLGERGTTPLAAYRRSAVAPDVDFALFFTRAVEHVLDDNPAGECVKLAGLTLFDVRKLGKRDREAFAVSLLRLAALTLRDSEVQHAFGVTAAAVRRITDAFAGVAAVMAAAAEPLQLLAAVDAKAAAEARATAAADAIAAELMAEEAAEKQAKPGPAKAGAGKKAKSKQAKASAAALPVAAPAAPESVAPGPGGDEAAAEDDAAAPGAADPASAAADAATVALPPPGAAAAKRRARRKTAARSSDDAGAAASAAQQPAVSAPPAVLPSAPPPATIAAPQAAAPGAASAATTAEQLSDLLPWLSLQPAAAPSPQPQAPLPPLPAAASHRAAPAPMPPKPKPSARSAAASAASDDDTRLCVICLTEARSTLLLPCKHLALCGEPECFATLGAPPLCPLCRVPVADTLTVFV
jgi:hypothetical protein